MEKKKGILSPSAKAYLVFMAKVKGKTPLEVMREFNEGIRQQKRKVNLPDNSQ